MTELVHLRPADARRVPWRNGRGFTDELALWPPGASFESGTFDARISKASVDAPGPFSAFAGFDRVLVVTDGAGLVLDHGGRAPDARIQPLVPYAFSGDWPTSAALVGGPVADFNVIVRRGRLAAAVRPIELGAGRRVREQVAAGDAFVHVVSGGASASVDGSAPPLALAAGDSLWLRDALDAGRIDIAAGPSRCVVLLVTLRASS